LKTDESETRKHKSTKTNTRKPVIAGIMHLALEFLVGAFVYQCEHLVRATIFGGFQQLVAPNFW
jgi:hypothetical protein